MRIRSRWSCVLRTSAVTVSALAVLVYAVVVFTRVHVEVRWPYSYVALSHTGVLARLSDQPPVRPYVRGATYDRGINDLIWRMGLRSGIDDDRHRFAGFACSNSGGVFRLLAPLWSIFTAATLPSAFALLFIAPARRPGSCRHCGYDLRGLQPAPGKPGPVCPECGRAARSAGRIGSDRETG